MPLAGVTLTRTEYGGVILDMRRGKYFQLNEAAADVAELLLAGQSSVDDLTRALTDRYEVSAERAQADVLQCLAQLQGLGLVPT